jgi:hypothetical protein
LIKRSLREALMIKFGAAIKDVSDFNKLALAADDLADSMIAQQLQRSDLPSYFDLKYFERWNRRYHMAAKDSAGKNLRQPTLSTALLQATFSYESEYAVDARDALMLCEFNRIYDAYVQELRNMLGNECLN